MWKIVLYLLMLNGNIITLRHTSRGNVRGNVSKNNNSIQGSEPRKVVLCVGRQAPTYAGIPFLSKLIN
jgi:hypothetical protein